MPKHKIVSREDWLVARKTLLAKEKEFTRARDRLNAERLALPWVRIDKSYEFEGPDGTVTMVDLFAGRSQLAINHFMLGPGWKAGCVGCSFGADHIDGGLVHLENHDVSVVAVSRAPWPEIAAYKKRMGWQFPWVSSHGSDFNFDFHVSFTSEDEARGKVYYNYEMQDFAIDELPGLSAFYRDDSGTIFHTYSSYARGAEELITTYMLLDLMPKGRNEQTNLMDWVKRHDEYCR